MKELNDIEVNLFVERLIDLKLQYLSNRREIIRSAKESGMEVTDSDIADFNI